MFRMMMMVMVISIVSVEKWVFLNRNQYKDIYDPKYRGYLDHCIAVIYSYLVSPPTELYQWLQLVILD